MPKLMVDPLPPGCPWSGFTPPNVDWCEEELCSWIVNPADTWSNLAYVFFGVLMWRHARRAGAPALASFGPASILVGVFSFVYHASYTYMLQFFDFVGMFVFCFLLVSVNAVRLGWLPERRVAAGTAAGTVLFSLFVPLLSQTTIPIQSLIGVLIAMILGLELAIWRRHAEPEARYGIYAVSLACMTMAALASLADVTRTVCDPTNHFVSGHAIWHVLTAATLYGMYVFYTPILQAKARAGAGEVAG